MSGQELAQLGGLFVARCVCVYANGPQAAVFFDGPPKLLRNPCNAGTQEGHAGKAVRQRRDSLGAKRCERRCVEAVTGRDEDSGIETVAAQNP